MDVWIKRNNLIDNIISYLFFILVVGFFLFGRVSAHLNLKVFNLPVYVTELFLISAVIIIFISSVFLKDGRIFLDSKQRIEFLLFYIIFIISLVRGLISYRDIVFTLRQSAIIYYSIFYFLVPIILDNFKKIKIYFSVLVICTSILALVRLFRIGILGLGSFGYYYISLSFIFLLFLSLLIKKQVLKKILYSLILIHLIIIILSEVRAAWMGLLSAILFIIFIFFKIPVMRKNLKKILFLAILAILILTIILPIFLISYPSSIEDIKDEFVSIYKFRDLETVSARNVMWRLFVWRDIIDLSLEKPILGYGFGVPFQSETLEKIGWTDYSGDEDINFTDPHNSYLSILFRTGFVGLLIFLIIIFRFFKLSINFILKCDNEKMRVYIASMLTTIVFILGTSFFMVVLEGPFLGIFLWINMGLVISIIRIAKADQ
ncbi:hypothetical protein ES707_21550 [subsurface metagenome]